MSSQSGETKGILNPFRTTKPLIKFTTPRTSPKTPGGSKFEGLPSPPVTPRTPSSPRTPSTPRTPRTPRNFPSQTLTPNYRLPETPASASAAGNITPVSPQPKDSLARQKSGSSVSKAAGPRGTTTGEIKKSRPKVVRPKVVRSKVSKATVARVNTVIEEIDLIRNDKTREDDDEFKKWPLKPHEYEYLIDRVERDGGRALRNSSNKPFRYEYSTSWNEFSIRMSSDPLHAIFWDGLKSLIEKKLGRIADGKERYETTSSVLKDAAAEIKGYGDAAVDFDGVNDRKGPDASFFYDGCTSENEEDQAPFVIEVNWSNLSSKKLAKKAEEYIELSDGKVRTVLNIDLIQIYQKSKNGKNLKKDAKGPAPAFASVWRSYGREEGEEGQQATIPRKDFEKAFRDSNGEPNSDFELVLFLSDFMCQDCAKTLPGCTDTSIKITAEELCDIYKLAVKKQVNRLERKSKQTGRGQPRLGTMQRFREAVRSRSGRPLIKPDRLGFPHDT